MLYGFDIECSATQPVVAQMFHASGERERGGLDSGRSGILQAPSTTVQYRVREARQKQIAKQTGQQNTSPLTLIKKILL